MLANTRYLRHVVRLMKISDKLFYINKFHHRNFASKSKISANYHCNYIRSTNICSSYIDAICMLGPLHSLMLHLLHVFLSTLPGKKYDSRRIKEAHKQF